MKDEDALGVIFFVIGIAIACWLFSESLPFRSEVTVYRGWCAEARQDDKCKAGEEAFDWTTYKASFDLQMVVYWSEDGLPNSMKRCSVRDFKNWSCHDNMGALPDLMRSMVGGEILSPSKGSKPADNPKQGANGGYTLVPDGPAAPRDLLAEAGIAPYQVPKWYWWWLTLHSRLKPAPAPTTSPIRK